MPRYYVAEWIVCPLCNERTQRTAKGLIFKHSYVDYNNLNRPEVYTPGWSYGTPCQASKLPYENVKRLFDKQPELREHYMKPKD